MRLNSKTSATSSSLTKRLRSKPLAGKPLPDPTEDLELIRADDFHLDTTLHSGQAFRWIRVNGGHAGVLDGNPVFLRQMGDSIACTKSVVNQARHYLALDHDFRAMCAGFPKDATMETAISRCFGMRILRQPIWECLAGFICSSQKQVAHIRAIQAAVCTRFGVEVGQIGMERLRDFPGPDKIAQACEADLRGCAMGYRAPNLLKTARIIASGAFDLEKLRFMTTEEARSALVQLPGVGVKVANCVLLFALERLDVVPVDVWIDRILRRHYVSPGSRPTAKELALLAEGTFGRYAGYAQQMLFHTARMQKAESRNKQIKK